MKKFGLTTKDNPYDVFDDYINWMTFDHQKSYNTAEYLARLARTSEDLSEEENQKEIERVIDSIIMLHPVPQDTTPANPSGDTDVDGVQADEHFDAPNNSNTNDSTDDISNVNDANDVTNVANVSETGGEDVQREKGKPIEYVKVVRDI